MLTDSDSLPPPVVPPQPRDTYQGACRRCQARYECGAIRFGGDLWPFTFYCDACFDTERAAQAG